MVNIIIGVVGALLIRRVFEGASALQSVKEAQEQANLRALKNAELNEIENKQQQEWYE